MQKHRSRRNLEMLCDFSIFLGQCPNTCAPVSTRSYLWRHTSSFTLAQIRQSVNICQVRLNLVLTVTKQPYCHTSENRGRWPLRLSTNGGDTDKAGAPQDSQPSWEWRLRSRGVMENLRRSGSLRVPKLKPGSRRDCADKLPYQKAEGRVSAGTLWGVPVTGTGWLITGWPPHCSLRNSPFSCLCLQCHEIERPRRRANEEKKREKVMLLSSWFLSDYIPNLRLKRYTNMNHILFISVPLKFWQF